MVVFYAIVNMILYSQTQPAADQNYILKSDLVNVHRSLIDVINYFHSIYIVGLLN